MSKLATESQGYFAECAKLAPETTLTREEYSVLRRQLALDANPDRLAAWQAALNNVLQIRELQRELHLPVAD
jgi:hypothetical protein